MPDPIEQGTYLNELGFITDTIGAELYAEKNGVPGRVKVGDALGLASLGPDGAMPSTQLKFLPAGIGAILRKIEDKLRELGRSPQDRGAVGDGVADDTDEVNNALSDSKEVRLFGDFHVTAPPTNPLGAEFKGPGRILRSITGGDQQLNSKVYDGQHMFGQQFLYAWHNKLFAEDNTSKLVASGDSTTFGDGSTAPWQFVNSLAAAAYDKGHLMTYVNAGHSSKHTGDWLTTYLTGDLASNPDLYIVRWGINDPYYGRTLEQFATDLRAGLAQCRASKTVAQMSILLMAPNSTSDTPNGRDEKWYEQARLVCRQAAIDYQCAYVDTYALWKDARGAAGLWMDNSFGDGRAIHPANIMNMWIASAISDFIFPKLMRPRIANQQNYTKIATALPSTYPFGWSHFSTPNSDVTFPVKNAHVLTFKALNGMCWQIAHSGWASEVASGAVNNGNLNKGQYAIRMGQHNGATDTWFAWSSHAPLSLTSLLQNSWVPFVAGTNEPSASMNNNIVTLSGLIKNGTVTNGTLLLTLPAGWRPRTTVEAFLCATGPTGTTTPCVLHLATNGQLTIQGGANANFIALSSISFEAGN